MIEDSKVLAIIPARKGSVGLKGKNIKKICGEPLISWSIKQCQASKYIDKIVVSTDCNKTSKIANNHGVDVPYLRPKRLSLSSSTTYDTIEHLLKFLKKNKNENFDYIVLIEPTSPLRKKNDIDNIIYKLKKNENNYDSIVSIGTISEHPSILKKIEGSSLLAFDKKIEANIRRQLLTEVYFPYGVAYVVKEKALLKEKSFYTKRQTYFLLERFQNYEIDDIYDFICIENIMKYKKYNINRY